MGLVPYFSMLCTNLMYGIPSAVSEGDDSTSSGALSGSFCKEQFKCSSVEIWNPITVKSSQHGVGLMALRLRVRFRTGAIVCGYTRLRRNSTSVVSRTFPMTFGSRCGVGVSLQSAWRPHTNIGLRGPTLVAPMRVTLQRFIPQSDKSVTGMACTSGPSWV